MVEFMKLDANGTCTKIRSISQHEMSKCPHFIMVAEHYREDNSCRCNDITHNEMLEWGYVWGGTLWIAPEEEED